MEKTQVWAVANFGHLKAGTCRRPCLDEMILQYQSAYSSCIYGPMLIKLQILMAIYGSETQANSRGKTFFLIKDLCHSYPTKCHR